MINEKTSPKSAQLPLTYPEGSEWEMFGETPFSSWKSEPVSEFFTKNYLALNLNVNLGREHVHVPPHLRRVNAFPCLLPKHRRKQAWLGQGDCQPWFKE